IGHVAEERLDRRPIADYVEPVDGHPPAVRRVLADEHAEGAALAGAVRPEQAEQFPAADFQVEAVDGDERAVADAQFFDPDDWVSAHPSLGTGEIGERFVVAASGVRYLDYFNQSVRIADLEINCKRWDEKHMGFAATRLAELVRVR